MDANLLAFIHIAQERRRRLIEMRNVTNANMRLAAATVLRNHYDNIEARHEMFLHEVRRICFGGRQPKRPRSALRVIRVRRRDPLTMGDREMRQWGRCTAMQFRFMVTQLTPLINQMYFHRNRLYESSLTPAQIVFMFMLKICHHFTYRLISFYMGCGLSRAYFAVKAVVTAIRTKLTPLVVRSQSFVNLLATERSIWLKYGVPGASYFVDGSLLPRFAVAGPNRREYYDRKGGQSMVVQLSAASNHLICHITVGYPGGTHDAAVYRESTFGMDNEAGFLTNAHRLNVGGIEINPITVADMAYCETGRTLRSHRGPGLPMHEVRLRTRLARARGPAMEGVYGISKRRFRWLGGKVSEDIPMQNAMTEATCTYHNVLILTSTTESFAAFIRSANARSATDEQEPLIQTGLQVHQAYLRYFELI